MKVYYEKGKNRVPIKVWTDTIEDGCLEQATNLSNLPFIHKHISLMPDTHQGYGMPIGGVIGTKGVVIPNAVGVDIGCGMGFIETNIPIEILSEMTPANGTVLKSIIGCMNRNIPTGFKKHKEPQEWMRLTCNDIPENEIIMSELENAMFALGTLGGGNHFIELQATEDNKLCIMLHSGSRNFGYKIAKHYNELAIKLNERWHTKVDPKWELAFLPLDTQEGVEYLESMNFALAFAEENRKRLMEKTKSIVFNQIKKYTDFTGIETIKEVNIHHNYVDMENHFGDNVMIHRKGAIRMREGELGIIPGSMGTSSYIVKGKGEENSFCSASHGAGRAMGRKEFMRTHTKDSAIESMKHIEYKFGKDYSEAPAAYKNIDTVIENEKDLIDVILKLRPLGVIKG